MIAIPSKIKRIPTTTKIILIIVVISRLDELRSDVEVIGIEVLVLVLVLVLDVAEFVAELFSLTLVFELLLFVLLVLV